MDAITVTDLYKSFRLPHEKHGNLKQASLNVFKRRTFEELKILKGISFEVKQGEFFGIVGRNGSGKSTLLKTLAGIYAPTSGTVRIDGQLTPFIELGVGFNPELTGRDNVYLNGTIFGMKPKEIDRAYHEIVAFSELEKFMDQKLKNYSSGMQVRLAFSIAVQAKTEILLIDEVLAVGDAIFQQKCFRYFKELKRSGRTVVFVSHDINALQEYCDRGVLIENGEIMARGPIAAVTKKYQGLLNAREEAAADSPAEPEEPERWGAGGIQVASGATQAADGAKRAVFSDGDADVRISLTYEARQPIDAPVYGITVTDAAGVRVFQSNTLWSNVATGNVAAGQKVSVVWDVPNAFSAGQFAVAPAVADRSGTTIYDWYDGFLSFKVRKELRSSAIINVPHAITVSTPS